MKKETFLNHIQGMARSTTGAQKVWEIAIKTDGKDPRWNRIYDESESPVEAIRQFCKYFEIPVAPRKPHKKRRTQVERWTEALEKAKTQKKTNEIPDENWIFEDRIKDLEEKLAYAVKNNL